MFAIARSNRSEKFNVLGIFLQHLKDCHDVNCPMSRALIRSRSYEILSCGGQAKIKLLTHSTISEIYLQLLRK